LVISTANGGTIATRRAIVIALSISVSEENDLADQAELPGLCRRNRVPGVVQVVGHLGLLASQG